MKHTQIEKVYIELLKLNPINDFRVNNQDIYARIRDYIAKGRNEDGEYIQDYFETLAKLLPIAEAGL